MQEFKADENAVKQLLSYLSERSENKEKIKDFFKQREKIKGGKYPDEVVNKLLDSFLYWPGLDVARRGLTNEVMRGAGIPYAPNPSTGGYTWGHSGVVIPLAQGFKLHYYTGEKTKKINSRGAKSFPVPAPLNIEKPVILVEGELDALVANAAGIDNVYSTGSVTGLTEEMIKACLLPARTIIFLYDNDDVGKSAVGAIPNISASGIQRPTVPEKLRKCGYTGSIKIALLKEFKDADECVRNGREDLIKQAIEKARDIPMPYEDLPF